MGDDERESAVAVVALVVADVGLVVEEFAGIGAAFELLGVSRLLSVPLAALAIWAVVSLRSYRYAERGFLVLTLPFLAYPLAALLGRPTWTEVAGNAFGPHLVGGRTFLLLCVALIGTTITPYIQLTRRPRWWPTVAPSRRTTARRAPTRSSGRSSAT